MIRSNLLFIQVIAYLWKAIWYFHAPGSEEAERCVGERALQILNGSSDVAAGMHRGAILRHLSAAERKPVDICADYLLRYRNMLHYNDYLAPGDLHKPQELNRSHSSPIKNCPLREAA